MCLSGAREVRITLVEENENESFWIYRTSFVAMLDCGQLLART